jgi:hypothetical protein
MGLGSLPEAREARRKRQVNTRIRRDFINNGEQVPRAYARESFALTHTIERRMRVPIRKDEPGKNHQERRDLRG